MKNNYFLLACFLSCFGALFSEAKQEVPSNLFDQYGYVDLGLGPAPVPLPIFGIGYRMQSNKHGFDTNLRIATVGEASAFKVGVHYLRYFSPNLERQFYFGAGGAGCVATCKWADGNGGFISPEFIFGKSYLSDTGARRFLELSIDFPSFTFNRHKRSHYDWVKGEYVHGNPKIHGRMFWFPLVSLHYGWGF